MAKRWDSSRTRLHEMQHRRTAVEDDGIVFLAVEVDDLFAFGDRGEWLSGNAYSLERGSCGVKLAESAVDEDEAGHRLVFFGDAFVAAADDLAHGGEIVDALDGLDLKFAVVGLLHRAVFPDDHGGDGFRALDVGDVEALDAAGEFGEGEDVLQGFLDCLLAGLEDAEALVVALLGVLAGEVDERALFSALGDGEFDFVPGAFAEQSRKGRAVGKVDRDVDACAARSAGRCRAA